MGGGQSLFAFSISCPLDGLAGRDFFEVSGADYDGHVVSGFGKAMGKAEDI